MPTTGNAHQVARLSRRALRLPVLALALIFATGIAAIGSLLVAHREAASPAAPPPVVVVDRPAPMRTLVPPRPLRVPALAPDPAAAATAAPAPAVAPVAPVSPGPGAGQNDPPAGDTYVGPPI